MLHYLLFYQFITHFYLSLSISAWNIHTSSLFLPEEDWILFIGCTENGVAKNPVRRIIVEWVTRRFNMIIQETISRSWRKKIVHGTTFECQIKLFALHFYIAAIKIHPRKTSDLYYFEDWWKSILSQWIFVLSIQKFCRWHTHGYCDEGSHKCNAHFHQKHLSW